MILPTYYVKEMYVRFKDSPNRHLEFSMTKAVGALEPRRHQQLLSGEYQDHLHFPQKIKTLFKSFSSGNKETKIVPIACVQQIQVTPSSAPQVWPKPSTSRQEAQVVEAIADFGIPKAFQTPSVLSSRRGKRSTVDVVPAVWYSERLQGVPLTRDQGLTKVDKGSNKRPSSIQKLLQENQYPRGLSVHKLTNTDDKVIQIGSKTYFVTKKR